MVGSRIKGITVEIGGDTTKLQSALKGVNAEIKNTQSQLKDVGKLLKLDPGNTELLAQKQKLLSSAVSETKEKLATLKTSAVQIGERVCWNALFNAESSENNINDYFRDMFFAKGYLEVKDQSRHGVSASGKDAAEVDILLTKDGKEIGIFEGMKLNSINADYIDRHINKSITNYNALGTATFIVAYVNSANFEAFWERYSEHILHYDFPLQIKENFSPLVHPNAATRMASMILTRDGFDFPVYFIALKIS